MFESFVSCAPRSTGSVVIRASPLRCALPMAQKFAFVVDTNILIHHLDVITTLTDLSAQYNFCIVIPSMALQELDGHKTKEGSVGVQARAAARWIHEQLSVMNPGVHVQMHSELVETGLQGDDAIVDCCKYFSRLCLVVLISNDRIICTKALAHHIRTVTWQNGLTADEIAYRAAQEAKNVLGDEEIMEEVTMGYVLNSSHFEVEMPDATDKISMPSPQYFLHTSYASQTKLEADVTKTLLVNASQLVDYCVKAGLDASFLEYTRWKPPPPTVAALKRCIRKFTVELFKHVLPRYLLEAVGNAQAGVTSRQDLAAFVDLWGGVCIHLSQNDSAYGGMLEEVRKVCASFYA